MSRPSRAHHILAPFRVRSSVLEVDLSNLCLRLRQNLPSSVAITIVDLITTPLHPYIAGHSTSLIAVDTNPEEVGCRGWELDGQFVTLAQILKTSQLSLRAHRSRSTAPSHSSTSRSRARPSYVYIRVVMGCYTRKWYGSSLHLVDHRRFSHVFPAQLVRLRDIHLPCSRTRPRASIASR